MARHKFTDEEAAAQERMNAGGSYTDPTVPTTPRFDPDATMNGYRQTGDDMARRQAVQLNYGAANADRQNNLNARETQIQAGDMMRTAAVGGAPSRAAIEGAQVGDTSLEAQLGASAGRRGPALAQQNAAATGATGLQLQGANTAGLGRSAETNRALLAYGQNTGAMRKGDYTLQQLDQRQAEAQAQQQINQNRRNQTGQMDMEQLGLNDEQARMDLSNRESNLINKQNFQTQTDQENRTANGARIIKGVEDMIPSDKRVKSKAALPGLAAKGRAMLDQQDANRTSLDAGPSVGGGPLTGLAAKGRAMLDQTNAQRDSLRYGSSLDHSRPTDDVDERDVNQIRYGHEPYRGDMFKRDIDKESNIENLHAGIERRLQRDADRPAEQAEDEHAQVMREHAASPRGYDLGTGYSEDPVNRGGGNTYAPGTNDWLQYGKPRQVLRPVKNADEYIPGQAPTEKVDAPMDDYSRAVSMSDANAKRAAFLDGVNATQQMHDTGVVPPQPEYMREEGSGQPRAAGASPGGRAASLSAPKPSRDAEAYREYLRRGDVREKRDKAFEVLETPQPGAFSSFSAAGQAGAGLEPYFRQSKKPQQPGPTTARPVPPPIKDTGDFDKGVELQFGGPPKAEVPDERAKQHLEKAKVLSMIDAAPERMSDERAKTIGGTDEHALQQDANRKLVGSTYVYKDGVGEDPNQVHHGQMAQTMEENPITATAVREGPDGFKRVSEFDKLNVTAAGVAELQREQDEMRAALARLQARRQRRV